MEQAKIDRINELARKSRKQALTAEEKAEQQALRREYIDAVVGSLKRQLDAAYIVDKDGKTVKLPRKEGR